MWDAIKTFDITDWTAIIIILVLVIGTGILLILKGFTFTKGDVSVGLREVKKAQKEERDILEDNDLGIELKKFMDNVDMDLHADLIAMTQELDQKIMPFYSGTNCEFPVYRFMGSIKSTLYSRINYNNLKERLAKSSRAWYVRELKNDIQRAYEHAHSLTRQIPCALKYPSFNDISDKINSLVDWWADSAIRIIKERIEQKCNKYREFAPQFKTELRREKHCTIPLKRNESSLAAL